MSLHFAFTGLIFCLYTLLFTWVGLHNYIKRGRAESTILPQSTLESGENGQVIKFSILIPFRNEAHNLTDLFNSLNALDFDLDRFEVLFIDDHSQDNGIEILEALMGMARFSLRIIQLDKPEVFGKKLALTRGVQQANHSWIITLDADSIVSTEWLRSTERTLINSSAKFLTGPVLLRAHKGLLYQLQASEFMALQALTKASYSIAPLLSNGANLTYSKKIFDTVSGYSGNAHISSGDDMFLMRKIAQLKTATMAYNPDLNAAVYTGASKSWQDYAAQQIRWMSKTSALNDPLLWLVALIVFFTNFSLVFWASCSLGATLWSLQSAPQILKFTITLFVIKFIVDHLSLWMSYGHLKDLKS